MTDADPKGTHLQALMETELRERQRLAGRLHDDVLQLLAAARMELHGAADTTEATAMLGLAIERGRDLCRGLDLPVTDLDPLQSIEDLLLFFRDQHGLHVTSDLPATLQLRELTQSLLISCLHELLYNVFRHASDAAAHVTVATHRFWIEIRVENPSAAALGAEGLGLRTLRQRVSAAAGTCQRWLDPSGRYVVAICLPYTDGRSGTAEERS